MRVLAVDPGTKRVGLAISDPSGVIATPLGSVPAEPSASLPDRLATVAREKEAARIVVGLPKRMDGSEGPEARAARGLADALRAVSGLPVQMVDERLSSAAAERALIAGGTRRQERRRLSDQVAAAIFLQSYLDAEARRHGR
ncbi:MAG TPA: Holliday junction resolvase RuvX [Candidatus Dormibacteraeota bacterium]